MRADGEWRVAHANPWKGEGTMKHGPAYYIALCMTLLTIGICAQDEFMPGGLDSAVQDGLERIVPDTIVHPTEGVGALGNWEPYASVVGNSVFLIEANTFADDGSMSMQRYTVTLQPVDGGAPLFGEAFFDDDGNPYRGPINNYRQNGNPGRVAGDARPGAVNFIAGGEASPNEFEEFQSDDRWDTGVVRQGRFACVQTYSLDPAEMTQTPLCHAFDAINGRLTGGDPHTDQISRFGGDLVALDNGTFLVVVEDRSMLHDTADQAVVAAIFDAAGSVVEDSFVISSGSIWSNIAAFEGGFCVRVGGVLKFYDNTGEFEGQVDQESSGFSFDRGRGDGTRIAGHINSPYVFLAGESGADVRLAVWDARDQACLAQINVNELTLEEGGTDEADFRPDINRVDLAVDALNRVVVTYEVTPAGFLYPQTAARVLWFDEENEEFTYLTASFFPFVNFTDAAGDIRTIRASPSMTTRQICIAAKGEINTDNDPSLGADSAYESNFYTVFAHPDPRNDPTPPVGGEPTFVRGDTNADDNLNIADAVSILGYLFGGFPPPSCLDAADTNDDGGLNIADAITTLGHLFGGLGDLPAPFGACGVDPTPDELDCVDFPPCGGEE